MNTPEMRENENVAQFTARMIMEMNFQEGFDREMAWGGERWGFERFVNQAGAINYGWPQGGPVVGVNVSELVRCGVSVEDAAARAVVQLAEATDAKNGILPRP